MNDKIILVAKTFDRLAGRDQFQRTVVCIHNPKPALPQARDFSQ